MKTVTIPTCANPFVVIINGRKYTYPAGETVEVPDEVAEVIERHEEAKPQPESPSAPSEGGNSGGGLPVVELTSLLTNEQGQVAFTESESGSLTAAFETGLPIIVKCNIAHTIGFQMTNAAMLASRGVVVGIDAFSFSVGSIIFQLVKYDGTNWAFLTNSWEG